MSTKKSLAARFAEAKGQYRYEKVITYRMVKAPNPNRLQGLSAWIPKAAPSTTDFFFGVDRDLYR